MRRRGLLAGLLFAPAIIRTPGLLMAVKPLDLTLTIQEFMRRYPTPYGVEFFEGPITPSMIGNDLIRIMRSMGTVYA